MVKYIRVSRKSTKRDKAYILFYLYMLLVLMTLLVSASFTWISLSRTPRVSDLKMYITTQSGLELSMDPGAEEWVLQLDFLDMVSETTPLRPVTWSDAQQRFLAASYGIDGRLLHYDTWHVLSDETNSNTTTADGYYVKVTFYARCGQKTDVTLSPAVEVNDGVDGSGTYVMGVPVWNPGHYEVFENENGDIYTELVDMGHDNGGYGAENAIRLGFRITYVDKTGTPIEEGEPAETTEPTETVAATDATETTAETDATGTSDATEPAEVADPIGTFFIFEPNCDLHADGSTGYVATPSIDGTETLIDAEHLIRQTASTFTDTDPIEHGVVIQTLGDLIDNLTLFKLAPGQIVRIELYIWLEGQDIDCLNQSSGAQIQANIQFAGSTGSQSGMVEIEE